MAAMSRGPRPPAAALGGHRPWQQEAPAAESAASAAGPPPADAHRSAAAGGRRRRPGGRAAGARAAAGGRPPEERGPGARLEEEEHWPAQLWQGPQGRGPAAGQSAAAAAQASGEHERVRGLGSLIKRADRLNHDDVPVACELVRGQVLRLSMDQAGCFLIQFLLESAQIPSQKQLVAELHGHAVELLESQHGNHVLQKAIETLPPPAVSFVLRELCEWRRPRALARHKYGCRVLERLLEHFPMPDIWHAIDDVLGDVCSISEDPYGNFVVQHILEHGDGEHRGRIARALGADLRSAATHPNVCLVLNKALTYAAPEDQRCLVKAVVSQGLLADMAVQRTGFATTLRLFKVATGPLLQEAHRQLRADARRIESTKHGRALLDIVSRESPSEDMLGDWDGT